MQLKVAWEKTESSALYLQTGDSGIKLIIQKFSNRTFFHRDIKQRQKPEKTFRSEQAKKKRRFENGICAFHHGKCPFASWSFLLFIILMLSYIFPIHLCNVHFVAIHHKTGIIKCLYILNVEWDPSECVRRARCSPRLLFDCSIFLSVHIEEICGRRHRFYVQAAHGEGNFPCRYEWCAWNIKIRYFSTMKRSSW